MDEDEIRKAISRVKLEYEAEYECHIEYLTQEDYDYKSPWKIKYATGLKAFTDSIDSDEKPAARKDPIKGTQTLKEPIKGSHLGKRLRQSESGSTDMDPVVTEFDFNGQGRPWRLAGEPIPKASFKEGKTYFAVTSSLMS